MDNIDISILNYENKLLADRKQLNDLIYECNNQEIDSSLLRDKISHMQAEIDYMDKQLNILKAGLESRRHAGNMQLDTASQRQAVGVQTQYAAPQQQTPYMQPRRTLHKPKDLENMIGKSWMGIFASVLIFISFILFATLLAPYITDTIKMIAMYAVSILFTAFGLIRLKNHSSKLYLSISGCGVGAVYISLLLTNLYFKAIGDIALYLFILVWAVFVCYLSKWRDRVFQIIGQCGIAIALLFGIILCVKTDDGMKLFLLSLFFAVTAAIFYVSSYNREFHKNVINNIFNCINVFQLGVGAYKLYPRQPARLAFLSDEEMYGFFDKVEAYEAVLTYISAVIIIFLILQFVLFLIAKLKEKNTGFGVFMVINTILLMIGIYVMLCCVYDTVNESAIGAVFIIIGFMLLGVMEKKCNNRNDDGKILMQLFALPLFIFSVYMVDFFQNHIGVSFIMVLFILLGYYKDDYVYKYGSLAIAAVYCFSDTRYSVEHLCLGLLFFAILAVLMYVKKEQYNVRFKLYSYVTGLVFIIAAMVMALDDMKADGEIAGTIILTTVALLNVLAMKSRFIKDFQTMQTEKAGVYVTRIINALLMAVSLYAVVGADNEICHFVLVLLAILLFMVNTVNLIAENKGMLSGIYIGVKLTVLLVNILVSFDAANYVISISAFLFAIISIVLGFKFYVKPFRIYGLILSLISVAKLILVDISYDNTLGHALSFFVCGLLCFVISMIYHLIDKRMQDNIENMQKKDG